MDETNFERVKQADGYISKVYYYPTKADIRGTVLIIHGMAEHHGRYAEFINFLNGNGFDVFAYDHRGHGEDKKLSELGSFAKKNGYKLVINDAVKIIKFVDEAKRSDSFILFGHSMGSIVARCAIQQYDKMDCVILSGVTMPANAKMHAGIFAANLFCLGGSEKPCKKLDDIMHNTPYYKQLCERTQFDWLTRNNTIVGQYINDPYSGFLCSAGFFRDLMKMCLIQNNQKNMVKTRKDLPIFIFAGDNDPVGSFGKEPTLLYDTMNSLGFTNIGLKLYPEARHEILNETNSDEVMNDMLQAINECI
ncbi:MAG: alpha/beta hydrolase [Lachnospiraceae bacterium]|nr:alpha/beta hydrolase [Lachnospiraceae bacterium]